MKNFTILLVSLLACVLSLNTSAQERIKMAVVGMTHDHVHQVLKNLKPDGVEIIGFAEPNKELAMRHFKNYNIPESLWYPSLEEMLKAVEVSAVCDFRSVKEHLETVEFCAPKGIHVMVEKPLASNMKDGQRMYDLAKKHNIHLITNYETTWYASHHKAYEMIHSDDSIGEIKKLVIHDGHKGPKEIGCSTEFLDWLTDPVMNGGGAIVDFGCYGANLSTWFLKGEKPISVFAITQTHKPLVYPKVDDEATIIVEYENAQAIIQASWNWPYDRKDIEIYGQKAALFADRKLEVGFKSQEAQKTIPIKAMESPMNDAFTYFAAVVNGKINAAGSLGGLVINLQVVEILDAAVRSAKTGKRIYLR